MTEHGYGVSLMRRANRAGDSVISPRDGIWRSPEEPRDCRRCESACTLLNPINETTEVSCRGLLGLTLRCIAVSLPTAATHHC